MAPATANSTQEFPHPITRGRSLLALIRFTLSILLLSAVLSSLVAPLIGWPWWKVWRRCVSVAAGLSLWLCITKFERRSFRAYGLSWSGAGKRQFLFGLGLGSAMLAVVIGLGLLSGAYRLEVTPDHFRLWRTVIGFLPVAIMVSVLEELVFRGFILQHLLAWHKAVAVILTSFLYAVVHLKIPTVNVGISLELTGLFLLGCVLAIAYLQTGSLALSIGLHSVLAYGARVNKLLFQFPNSYSSISWLMGTSRLVNGLISWVALFVVGALIMWRAKRFQQSKQIGGVSP